MCIVRCPYCEQPAELIRGDGLYRRRPDLHGKLFWRCAPCDAHVGLHADGRPMGRLAGPQLRRLRQMLHAAFDPFWKVRSRRQSCKLRKRCYAKLAKALGIEVPDCHVGHFDEDRCQRAIDIVERWERA